MNTGKKKYWLPRATLGTTTNLLLFFPPV